MRLSRNLPAWIYTLSLHDALPISPPFLFSCPSFLSLECSITWSGFPPFSPPPCTVPKSLKVKEEGRSEEHTSELQSRGHLVCRLLLENKKIDAEEPDHTREQEL